MNEQNIKYASSHYDPLSSDKEPFNYILWNIKNEEQRIWNSSELHQKASTIFKILVKSDTDEEEDVKTIAQIILSEIKEASVIKDSYPALDKEEIFDLCWLSLLSMLSIMSPNFQSNLYVVAFMSSMIKTVMTLRISILQVALDLEVQEILVWIPSNCFIQWCERI